MKHLESFWQIICQTRFLLAMMMGHKNFAKPPWILWTHLLLYIKKKYIIQINFGEEKIWRNWHKMTKIAKLNPRQIFFSCCAKFNNFLAAPDLIHGEETLFLIKKSKFAFTLLIFLTEFLVCRTKQRFLSMFMIILSLEKKY